MLVFQPGLPVTECSREAQNDSREFYGLGGEKRMQNVGSCCIYTAQGPELGALPLPRGLKMGGRGRFKREGTYVYIWLIPLLHSRNHLLKKQLSSDLKTNQKKGG